MVIITNILGRLLHAMIWLAVACYCAVVGAQSGNTSSILIGAALALWALWVLVRPRRKAKPVTLAERLEPKS